VVAKSGVGDEPEVWRLACEGGESASGKERVHMPALVPRPPSIADMHPRTLTAFGPVDLI
jgi:hypothetical protein